MAKQRINPEVQTDRVFQPVSQPVDLYYRPNLSAVELSRTGQIIDALKAFSPQLERFTSDIVAMNIATEKQVGAMEAMSGTVEAASAKAAKAIEGAGGVNPWRYEAFLDTMGRRMVREKYQASLYQNIEDLSALTNPDGTLRSGDYVTQKMNEFFTGVEIPQGSYFASRAAMDEKTKIDAQFLPMVQAKHAEKLKAQNYQDLKDEMFGILGRQSTLHLADDGREIRSVMERFRQLTGTSGAEVFTDALVEFAQSEANAGDFDSAMNALRAFEKDGKYTVEGIELGASYAAKINSAMDSIEAKKLQDDTEQRRNRLLAYQDALNSGMSLVTEAAHNAAREAEARGEIAAVSMTQDQMMVSVNAMIETLKETNRFPEDMEGQMRSALMDQFHAVVNSTNRPVTNNPNSIKLLSDLADQGIPSDVYKSQVWDMVRNRQISYETALGYIAQYDSKDAMLRTAPAVKGMAVSLVDYGIANAEDLTPSERANMLALVQADQSKIDTLANGVWRAEIMQLPEAERGPAMAQKYADIRAKVLAESVAANKERIQKADMRRNVEVALSDKTVAQETKGLVEGVMGLLEAESMMPDSLSKANEWITGEVTKTMEQDYLSLLEQHGDPDKARRELIRTMPSRYTKMLTMVMDMNNTDVPIAIRSSVQAQYQRGIGAKAPTEDEVKRGIDQTLQDSLETIGDLRNVRPDVADAVPFMRQTRLLDVSDLKRQAKEAVNEIQQGSPAGAAKMEDVKSKLQGSAYAVSSVIMWNHKVQSGLLGGPEVNLYKVQGGQVSVWNGRAYQPSAEATENYRKLRGIGGYKLDELRSGATKEGVQIDFARMDPKSELIVGSKEELGQLMAEYTESNGKSGILANWMQARLNVGQPIMDYNGLIEDQVRLYQRYYPRNK